MIANDVNRTACRGFKIVFCFHQQERIRRLGFHKHIYIAIVVLLIPCRRAEKSKRQNAIFNLQSLFASIQYVYTFLS